MKGQGYRHWYLAGSVLTGGIIAFGWTAAWAPARDANTPKAENQWLSPEQQVQNGQAIVQEILAGGLPQLGQDELARPEPLISAPKSEVGDSWITTETGMRVRFRTRIEGDAASGAGTLATGGAVPNGGACTCDSQCAAASGECRVSHCVGGVCVQGLAPVDTVCNFEPAGSPLFCTLDRCNDAGVCIDSRQAIGGATRLSPCSNQCCTNSACTTGSFQNCVEAGNCPGTEGCFPKRQVDGATTYVAQCDETDQANGDLGRCFVAASTAPTVPIGRCCSAAGACSETTEAACTGNWWRWRDPDDSLHACTGTLGCPSYSSGIAPVDVAASQTNLGPVVPYAKRCSIGLGLCELNSDCITRCNGGTRLNEACSVDLECPGALCQPIDLCLADSTECQLAAPSFNSIGDDYSLSIGRCSVSGASCTGAPAQGTCPAGQTCNASYLRLSEFRFRGGVSEPKEIVVFEFYDSSFSPPRLVNAFAQRFDNVGVRDYRLNFDCSPNCDLTQPQGSLFEEEALDPPFIIPPNGFVVMRASRAVSLEFGENDSNAYWATSVSAPEVGTNDGGSMWVNGVVGNGPPTLDVLAFDMVGEPLANPPMAACCDPDAPGPGNCTDRLEWDCTFCTDPARSPCTQARDCGLNNNYTCNSKDWKGAKTRIQINNDANRDCSGRYCFNPLNPNPNTLTPCTGTGQGSCAVGQTCEAPCEKASCCTPSGCVEVTTIAACVAAGGTAADVVFGQGCTPNCCPQTNSGFDCCKDFRTCSISGAACNFRCSNNPTRQCTEDFDCDSPGTCVLPPAVSTQGDCPAGQTCNLTCDGPDGLADPRIQNINVPTYVDGTEQVVMDFQGITAGATFFDDCSLGEPGWYQMFTIGKVDANDTCAVVTQNFCCSDPVVSPIGSAISRSCPCAGGETIFADNNALGQMAGFGPACNNSYCCTDQNVSIQWTLRPGTYIQGIPTSKSCSNSTNNCFVDADCDPGTWCILDNAAYQGHMIAKPCPPAACCGSPADPGPAFCSVTDQFTCEFSRKYCKTNQAACTTNANCPVGDVCLPGVFLGNKEVAPVPECVGDPCTLGACCIGPGNCADGGGLGITFAACNAQNGTYLGGFRCSENPCPVCPIETQGQCQTATTGQFILPSDRIIGVRRADDFKPAGSVIKRICFFPCYIGVTASGTGFECAGGTGGGTPAPDNFIAKFYEDDLINPGKPGLLVAGVPVNGFNLVVDAKLNSAPDGGSRCWRYTAPINPPAGLTVTPGDCLWIEVTGLGEQQTGGLCLLHQLSSADGNNYSMRDVSNSYELSDFDKNDLAFCIDSGIQGATSPPLSQDGGCGNFPVACCRPGTCIDGGTYTQCVGTNAAPVVGFPFPFVTCSQITCPVPPNDLCSTAPLMCAGATPNPNLGVCSISEGPPNINEVCDQTIGGTASRDCASTAAVCGPLPVGSVGYRCQWATDSRLASTDGPNTTNSGGNCFASGLNSFQADIWYKYTAPCNGALTIHSCGPNKTYDSMLQVFSTGTPTEVVCPPTNNVQHVGPCSDDNCGTNSSGSATNFNVVNGASYLIRYGGYSQLGSPADAGQNVSGLDLGVVCAPVVAAATPTPASPPFDRRKNRYLSFTPNNGTTVVAFRVVRAGASGGSCWVQTPITAAGNDQYTATCGANPVFRAWPEPVIHTGDCEIIPVADYTVFANAPGPVENPVGLALSTILLPTGGKWWGDNVGSNNGTEWTPPNQITNVNDVTSLLAFISGAAIKPHFTVANLQAISSSDPCLNAQVNASDVLIAVQAVAGATYGPASTTKPITYAGCAVPPSGGCTCCGN